MPPDPQARRTPDRWGVRGSQIEKPGRRGIYFKNTTSRKHGCPCGGRWWCSERLDELHDLLTRPTVLHGTPSSWEDMEVLGLDPLTGEQVAA